MQRTPPGVLHFSAENLSAADRLSYWRELFGRQTMRAAARREQE